MSSLLTQPLSPAANPYSYLALSYVHPLGVLSASSTSTPPAVTPPSHTTTPPTTPSTTKSSLCVSTTTTPPTCEYKCGNWCSDPLAPPLVRPLRLQVLPLALRAPSLVLLPQSQLAQLSPLLRLLLLLLLSLAILHHRTQRRLQIQLLRRPPPQEPQPAPPRPPHSPPPAHHLFLLLLLLLLLQMPHPHPLQHLQAALQPPTQLLPLLPRRRHHPPHRYMQRPRRPPRPQPLQAVHRSGHQEMSLLSAHTV